MHSKRVSSLALSLNAYISNCTIHRRITNWCQTQSSAKPYVQPSWCSHLPLGSSARLQLAQLPTPIHPWELPGLSQGFDVFIKRDDMTGCTLSGNKVRKLEFLLADALSQGCSHVITCGGIQSNHCRVTTVAATQLGLQSHLVLRSDIEKAEEPVYHGNLLFDRICGAELYFVDRKMPYETELKPRMERIAEKIKLDTGQSSYLIPVGGSSVVGLLGYLAGFQEMLDQGILDHVTDIVFACGSGGTAEGLALANYLAADCKLGIHGIAVCDSAEYFHTHCDVILQEVGVASVTSRDILDIVEGYKGEGYGLSTQEEREFLTQVARTTGIILDPTYTVKAARGMVLEMQRNPGRFKGNKVLFLHTGGVFGAMDDRLDSTLHQSRHLPQKTYVWKDLNIDPWS